MATPKKKDALSQHLDMYEDSWKSRHAEVKSSLWEFEDQLAVGLALYHSVVHSSYWAWFERVGRGTEEYDSAQEKNYKNRFIQWRGVCESLFGVLNNLEERYGGVEGGRDLRSSFREAQAILANWETPVKHVRVPSHTSKALSAQELATELDKVSKPATQENIPLQFKTDYDQVF